MYRSAMYVDGIGASTPHWKCCAIVLPTEQHSDIKDIKDVAAAVASIGPVMVIISLLNSLL